MGITKLWERWFGPKTILAQPGYDPTLESRRRAADDYYQSGNLPWVKIIVGLILAAIFFFAFLLPKLRPAQAAHGPTATATATGIVLSVVSPTGLPTTTALPSRTPFGQRPAVLGGSPTLVVNWPALTQQAIETLAAAPSPTPIVIIEYRDGGGGGQADPLPTYTPYPTPEPLQPLPTYTPYPTPTEWIIILTEQPTGTLEPTATSTPSPTPSAQPLSVPPGPYRVYLPLAGQ